MLWQIFCFEIRFWLRSWMVWIFLLIVTGIAFGATGVNGVFSAFSNSHRNAPLVIETLYAYWGLLTLLMSMAFVNSAATRDFSFHMHEILFSTPIKKLPFLGGRFLGAALVSLIPMLGISLGVLLAGFAPWADPDKFGPLQWSAHLQAILTFAVPNTFFIAAILFTIAVLARSELASFVGAIAVIVCYLLARILTSDLQHEAVGALLDPFGGRALAVITQYWSRAEINVRAVGLSGALLWNRLLWMFAGGALFTIACARFSFSERRIRGVSGPPDVTTTPMPSFSLPPVHIQPDPMAAFFDSFKIHSLGILKSTAFLVVMLLGLINCIVSLTFGVGAGYGNNALPVTWRVCEVLAGSVNLYGLIIVVYYSGVLVWKDRDQRMDEILDAAPAREWVAYVSRLAALLGVTAIIEVMAIVSGMGAQLWQGYHRLQPGLYAKELLLRDGSFFFFLAVLAFLVQVFARNKYAGYFISVVFLVGTGRIWAALNVATNMVRFGVRPSVRYSDFFGDAPFRTSWNWYSAYWLFFCSLLGIATVMFWPRGKPGVWKSRWKDSARRFRRPWKAAALLCFVSFAASAGWIYYNTNILRHEPGPKDLQRRQLAYEKNYQQFATLPLPRVRGVRFLVDIHPEKRGLILRADEIVFNPYSHPLDEIHFTLNPDYDTSITVPGASLFRDDPWLNYRIYRFDHALQPGEERTLHFTVTSRSRELENEVSNPEVTDNGTFVTSAIVPFIGYAGGNESGDAAARAKYGLTPRRLMPALERDCDADCREPYTPPGRSDWVDISTVISTSSDQIAIAPGSLTRQWQEGGRNYFEYRLDHPSLNFYCFASARYEVARSEWNGVKLEVYYNREHPWNVQRMANAMRRSLEYYTRNFGPYFHKEARIVEFPRTGNFAQSFPGTMMYSESMGFIADLRDPDSIDTVFYLVAHEMAHQWWAHQVIGANMQGATLLSESLAQYSALMVMEREYGRDMMRKFLRYQLEYYLRFRGREGLGERSLLTVERQQEYIHYGKGAMALYYLKEMIGEEAVNRALRSVLRRYGYAQPPYPASYSLVDALREQTPPNLQYLIEDLFEEITIFSNRVGSASATRLADGRYEITLSVQAHKFRADERGGESEVPLDDWIEIGAFASPEKGRRFGRTLYREKMRITSSDSTFSFLTSEMPEKAGVDPFLLMIDRIPDDNLKNVKLREK